VIGRGLLVFAVVSIALTGCDSRRGGTVGPFPQPSVPGTVVFASNRDDGHGEIYSMKDDGTHVVRLTFNGVQDAAPLLSPDGTKITFRRELNPSNVFLMSVDGSSAIGLAPGNRAEWSPDGSRLALVADSLGVMNSDATGLHFFGVGASSVTWSPDGTKLAYVSTGLGGQAANDIYTIASSGTGAHRVTTDGVAKSSLAWSPDGAKLLYCATQSVYVINVDGTGLASPCAGREARWSPDGQRVIFVTDVHDGNEEIYTARLDGTDPKNLSKNSANDTDPDWGPRP
jgi:Tol biopolymer transport system component